MSVASHSAPLPYQLQAGRTARLTYGLRNGHRSPLAYNVPGVARHRAPFAYSRTRAHIAALVYRSRASHDAPLPWSVPARAMHRASLALHTNAQAQHIAPLTIRRRATHGCPLPFAKPARSGHGASLSYSLAVEHRSGLPILLYDAGRAAHRAALPINENAPLAISNTVRLLLNPEVPIVSLSLARNQGQAYWTADIELARVEDYHRFPIAQPFVLEVDGLEYKLIVDRRQLTRNSAVERRPALRAVSECALYDAPFVGGITKTWESPVKASDIVRGVLSGLVVAWEMVDWTIPAYRLAVEGMPPMAVAARIVEAGGGVLEAMPDGSVLARAAYPVTVPDMPSAVIDAQVTAADDIYRVTEAIDASRGIDRVRVYDTSPNVSLRDRLEWEADELDGRTGIVHAYLSPWRGDVSLRHSRGASVSLQRLGEISRAVEDELIEIKAGEGNTRYPVVSIQSAVYESDDLGAVIVEPYTTAIRTSTPDYSLLRLSYTTRSLDHRATADADLVAQMILEDNSA